MAYNSMNNTRSALYYYVKIISLYIIILVSVFSCNNKSGEDKNNPKDSIEVKNSVQKLDSFVLNNELDKLATIISGNDTSNLSPTSKNDAIIVKREWQLNKERTLTPISNWMQEKGYEISEQTPHLMFYPFSGPDFSFAYSFYPNADSYVFAGLEPVGNFKKTLKNEEAFKADFLQQAQRVLYFTNNYGFFRTNDMRDQFKDNGAFVVILFYLKSFGASIGEVKMYNWEKGTSKIVELQNDTAKADACSIEFQFPNKKKQKLYYFGKDISDSGLENDGDWFNWIKSLKGAEKIVSLTKSASYLMHTSYFSKVRNFILKESVQHIQDDSGISLDYLTESKRSVQLYGKYTGVISLFSNRYQPKLKEQYSKDSTISMLPFKVGYNKVLGETNLQVVK